MPSAAPIYDDSPPVEPGTLFAGKYRVERAIGSGGMAFVIAARHEDLDQLVAIKLLRPEMAEYQEAAARFVREARAAARIQSDYVAPVYDVGTTENGQAYMVMEYLEGTDLDELLMTGGPLPIEAAVDHMLEALEAVAHAHALGIVHRDLKPANLFLAKRRDGSQRIKVLDFGISKAIESGPGVASRLTSPNALLGSPAYMSPEQATCSTTVDLRADIWSVGVILFELLTGRPPFEGDTPTKMLLSIATQPPIPLRAGRPDAPEKLERVILRCLERERENRFSNVSELARALSPFGSERTKPFPGRISMVLGMPAPSEPIVPEPGAPKEPRPPQEAIATTSAGIETRPTSDRKKRPAAGKSKGSLLKLALVATMLLGLGMIATSAWKAARNLTKATPASDPTAQPSSETLTPPPTLSPAPPAPAPDPSNAPPTNPASSSTVIPTTPPAPTISAANSPSPPLPTSTPSSRPPPSAPVLPPRAPIRLKSPPSPKPSPKTLLKERN